MSSFIPAPAKEKIIKLGSNGKLDINSPLFGTVNRAWQIWFDNYYKHFTTLLEGTTNEVEVAEDSGVWTIGLPDDVTIGNDLTVTNDLAVGGDLAVTGSVNISTCVDAGVDTDKFLVLDGSGNVDYRTGAELLSDIDAMTMANDVDNYILTATGSNQANGEANLQFDGTDGLIASTGKWQFGDSGTYIHQSADGILDIVTDASMNIYLGDNETTALFIRQGNNYYINVSTSDAAPAIYFGNTSLNPVYQFRGSGSTTFSGAVIASSTMTVATSLNVGATIAMVGTIDDDSFATATDTSWATSESIKAYVDNNNVILNNNTNNYLCTMTGTAYTVNGEANLQFDGSTLAITGVATISGANSLTIADYIIHSGDTNNYMGFSAADTQIFVTGGTTAMTINSSQNIGIGAAPLGTEAALTSLTLGATAFIVGHTGAAANQDLHITQNAHWDTDNSWEYIVSDKASNYYQEKGKHVFRVATSGTAGTDISWTTALEIDNSANVDIANGTLTVSGLITASSGITGYVDNNTNNYILTSTGGNTINGEANAQFDGSTLALTGAMTINGDITGTDTQISVTKTFSTAGSYPRGLLYNLTSDPNTGAATYHYGVEGRITTGSTGSDPATYQVYGLLGQVIHSGTKTPDLIVGELGAVQLDSGSGNVTEVDCLRGVAVVRGGTATQLTAVKGNIDEYVTSSLTDCYGVGYRYSAYTGTTFTLTNAYGFYWDNAVGAGTLSITNWYGIYFPDMSSMGSSISEAIHTEGGDWVNMKDDTWTKWGNGRDCGIKFLTDMIVDYDLLNAGTTDFRVQEDGTDRLVILTGGNATFSDDLTIGGDFYLPTGKKIDWNSGDVTLTHQNGAGLLLNSTNYLAFDNTSSYISSKNYNAEADVVTLTDDHAVWCNAIYTVFGDASIDDVYFKFYGASAIGELTYESDNNLFISYGYLSFGTSVGIRLPVYTDNVNNPPTDADLDTAIGAPSTKGKGFMAIVDDNDAGTNVYLVVSTGTDADKWKYLTLSTCA